MVSAIKNNRIAVLFLIIFGVIYSFLACNNEFAYGSSDSYNHFQIAKYSIVHPLLFLDHWGKPLYTLFFAPAAQISYLAGKLFNVFLALSTAWFIYLTSKELKLSNAWISLAFVLLAPIYVYVSISTLTETLFSFILAFSIYLFVSKKFDLSAIIISFIPMVRTEGFYILLVFALCFLLLRKFRSIGLLVTGSLIYSFIGFLALDDFFWLYNQIPYAPESIYGSGSMLHYVANANKITGKPIALFAILGIAIIIGSIVRDIAKTNVESAIKSGLNYLLILGCFAMYFLIHTAAWYMGKSGSFGLFRVMAAITPLAAIFANVFFDRLLNPLGLNNSFKNLMFTLLVFGLLLKSWTNIHHQLDHYPREEVLKETADWLIDSGYFMGQRIHYFDPYLALRLNVDPFKPTKANMVYWNGTNDSPLKFMNEGEILIWDSKFGPIEGKSPINIFLMAEKGEILKRFYSDLPYIQSSYNYFNVFVFRKNSAANNEKRIQHLTETQRDTSFSQIKFNLYNKAFDQLSGNPILVYVEFQIKSSALTSDRIRLNVDVKKNHGHYFATSFPVQVSNNTVDEDYINFRQEIILPPKAEGLGNLHIYIQNLYADPVTIKNLKVWVEGPGKSSTKKHNQAPLP